MADLIAMRLLVSGVVQGVGFREFVRRNAERLDVRGWVRNLADGRVEAHAEGNVPQVRALLERCREGPPSSRVDSVEAEPAEPEHGVGYRILPSSGRTHPEGERRSMGDMGFRSPDG